jgi:aminoglycoside 2'-N-acetyltransferase I
MDGPTVRSLATAELTRDEVAAIRDLLWAAFPPGDESFTEEDWAHAVGGTHVVLELGGQIVAHASVVERWLHVADMPLRTGYVEAVATAPPWQRHGLGTLVMERINEIIREKFQLGALGTGEHAFYERLGWRTWQGSSSVRELGGPTPTPGDDGYVMVLDTPTSPNLDLTAPISCEWRPGDVW